MYSRCRIPPHLLIAMTLSPPPVPYSSCPPPAGKAAELLLWHLPPTGGGQVRPRPAIRSRRDMMARDDVTAVRGQIENYIVYNSINNSSNSNDINDSSNSNGINNSSNSNS